jgi:hypothetical protein
MHRIFPLLGTFLLIGGYRVMDLKFDIKEKVDELVKKLQEDPALLKNFQSDPVKTLEQLTGIDLPEQQLQPVITGIKAKLGAGQLENALDGLKKLF